MSVAKSDFITALISGGAAGTSVDIILYPLDTIKTRLQSAEGFWKSGGIRGIYSGLSSVALGSAPGAAAFFCTYEFVKKVSNPLFSDAFQPIAHMAASSCGEVMACIIRVPVEVIKQRAQANPCNSSFQIFKKTLISEGFLGLYRGYFSTVMREIPFSLIQFPLWELLKKYWSNQQGRYVDSWQSSVCGAFSGGVAAGITTPLDVAKTRIMLAKKGTEIAKGNVIDVLHQVRKTHGIKGLYAGLIPRVLWMSLGGAIFLGVYEKSNQLIRKFVYKD
ncbi:mitochondrial S-adenosylmethionine carrier protein [Centruroides vittatus]|uniref:mitochondrial S-adenosylmethionine carrier protein n=1 Tax=Centruroides vittatus TaxID=120091 RepID=UPI0035102158